MVILNVKTCPDYERLGEYTFHYPLIKIGRSNHNNLPLEDASIEKDILCLKQTAEGLLIWEEKSGFYFSNGKKISGKKLHTVGDRFGLGHTEIEIKSFTPPQMNIDIEKRYDELTESHPFMADLFWALKQEMLKIEKDGEN